MVDKLTTIESLPDDVLLHIFFLCQDNPDYDGTPTLTWKWHRLAHVCRRWRRIVFAHPHHLQLGLVICKGPGSTTQDLGCWPAFPISVWYSMYDTLSPLDEDNIVAALEHSDRIREIHLPISDSLSISTIWFESFPALERLHIGPYQKHFAHLPRTFLGGSAPTSHRLRHIELRMVSIPALSQLLLSSRDLVSLSLGPGVFRDGGFFSPDALVTCLSATAQLESLCVHTFADSVVYEGEISTRSVPPLLNPVVLSALTNLDFEGSIEFLEDLVSRIRAPHLEEIRVCVSNLEPLQSLDISQLSQFISQTEYMRTCPVQTWVSLQGYGFHISINFPPSSPLQREISLDVICDQDLEDGGVSQLVNACRQLSPLISDVKQVKIEAYAEPTSTQGETDTALWLQLFRLFSGAQEVVLSCKGSLYGGIAHALELEQSTNSGIEVFPALRVLRLHNLVSRTPLGIKSFIAEHRRRTGRSIIVFHGNTLQESSEESD